MKMAKELEQMGADTLCIKDMANLLLPMDAYSLVKRLKESVDMPIHLPGGNGGKAWGDCPCGKQMGK